MCHPSIRFTLPSLEGVSPRRIYLRPPPLVVGPPQAAEGGSGEGRKVCLCSPTSHPGSFRCRYHHAEYEWCRMKLMKR
ncbi:hypothetical protein vseg_000522 [Gypsophila vaccaria]